MQYRLKKELPFAKAGDKVYQDLCKNFMVSTHNLGELKIGYEDDKQRLASEGWIEEVKPREFELHLDDSGSITRILMRNEYDNDVWNIVPLGGVQRISKTIRVREVL